MVRSDRRGNGALRPRGADGDEAMRRTVAPGVEHSAMMLTLATATSWQASVWVLREQRRDQGQRESREQQNGEQASHGIPDDSSVRPPSQDRSDMFPLVTQIP